MFFCSGLVSVSHISHISGLSGSFTNVLMSVYFVGNASRLTRGNPGVSGCHNFLYFNKSQQWQQMSFLQRNSSPVLNGACEAILTRE